MATTAKKEEPRPVMTGDCMDGQGKCVWPQGDAYEGDWKDGKHHGVGTFLWKSGSSYTGAWDAGMIHGEGKMVYSSGIVYRGGWTRGKPGGAGNWCWADGVRWEGAFDKGDVSAAEDGAYVFPEPWQLPNVAGRGPSGKERRSATFPPHWREAAERTVMEAEDGASRAAEEAWKVLAAEARSSSSANGRRTSRASSAARPPSNAGSAQNGGGRRVSRGFGSSFIEPPSQQEQGGRRTSNASAASAGGGARRTSTASRTGSATGISARKPSMSRTGSATNISARKPSISVNKCMCGGVKMGTKCICPPTKTERRMSRRSSSITGMNRDMASARRRSSNTTGVPELPSPMGTRKSSAESTDGLATLSEDVSEEATASTMTTTTSTTSLLPPSGRPKRGLRLPTLTPIADSPVVGARELGSAVAEDVAE